MIQIWSLTKIGQIMARSYRNPRSAAWKIIHHLDAVGARTTDQIATYTGLSRGDVSVILQRLKRSKPPIVSEGGQVEVG